MKIDIDQIAFDIDGVVADVVTPFLRIIDETYGYKHHTPDDILSFNLGTELGIPESTYFEVLDLLLEHPLEAGVKPYPGAADVLETFIRQAPLLFVTSRATPGPMESWFKSVLPNLPPERMSIVATGDPLEKLKPLLEHGRKYFIDDHPDTCRQLRQAGIEALVFDRPWNRADVDLPRVKGWEALKKLVVVRQ